MTDRGFFLPPRPPLRRAAFNFAALALEIVALVLFVAAVMVAIDTVRDARGVPAGKFGNRVVMLP